MIHPDTELRHVNAVIGYGVYATAMIPAGTVVYVKDSLEIELSPAEYRALPPLMQPVVNKYSYINHHGNRVMSWDHGKFVNHRCDANTMGTAYGCEIALTDIHAGQELTTEYGLLNIVEPFEVSCGCRNCRRVVGPDDVARHHAEWDERVRVALHSARAVAQPLWALIDPAAVAALDGFLAGTVPYRSVMTLKCTAPRAPTTKIAAAPPGPGALKNSAAWPQ